MTGALPFCRTRRQEYVKRVFYLSDYAKELRLNPEAAGILYDDFEKANEQLYQVEKRYTKRKFWLDFMRQYVSNDFFSDVLYISYLVFKAAVLGGLSYSSVAILYNSFGRLKRGMRVFTDVYPYAAETSLYVQKILDFMDYEPQIKSERKLPVSDQAKALELKNVSFSYGGEYGNVIRNISLSVVHNQTCGSYYHAGKRTDCRTGNP